MLSNIFQIDALKQTRNERNDSPRYFYHKCLLQTSGFSFCTKMNPISCNSVNIQRVCNILQQKKALTGTTNRAARIITGSHFDASAVPLIKSLSWQTIEELISSETNFIVFKTLNGLAPQYLTNLFTRNSQSSFHTLRNTSTDLKLPLMKTGNGQNVFHSDD